VKCSPPIRIKDVQVSITLDDSAQCICFVGVYGEHNFMNWSFASDREPVVDFLATVDQVLQVFRVCLDRGLV